MACVLLLGGLAVIVIAADGWGPLWSFAGLPLLGAGVWVAGRGGTG